MNCEAEGILGPTSNIVGALQANEVLKIILGLNGVIPENILIIDLLNLKFRKVKFKKKRLHMFKKLIFIVIFLLLPNQLIAIEENFFLMLKNNKVNVRYGPSFDYPIKYIYKNSASSKSN